ncbi:hybrid non-ribosomal peptide synthetase/type I polyketide synthase [Chitinophaga pendula]|uniref:hybrid non-ribosomal peptide synthetase/type I polyketide synthase n=1 Tax=Chitinophaga TaxID=79328 RepID=UPI000BB01FDE|nr:MULTISPECIES: hybrid non-ribosomal peptide synthetase/type I polyketide synthase [Chitinophaga]ASZ13662.1 hypothetical protein CK934_23260 [Chitinophaga sp. MD30]UCJ08713.1 hybrid non-ribosomal peptide synthetase/type I polyketide synthase [Chitinophaga pendula]
MSEYTGFEIAIIGMAGKFPGADDIHSFWNNLKEGVESVEFFSREEVLEEGETATVIDNPAYVKANAYLKGKEFFDASFFGYLPPEAELMDPQMRLFHEICWAALEDAGCNPNTPGNKIGLFAGATPNVNWEVYAALKNEEGLMDDYSALQLSNTRFLATRIAYVLNLKGWTMSVDTACSTSLVAVHQACRSLLVGDCTVALAGGVTVHNESKRGYLYQEGMIHSVDGHCRTFDAAASGTVGGEGAGVVVLKKLKNAIKDGDHIYAVIRGTGINNDGSDKVGYTTPSIDGQMEAIMTAHKWAKIEADTIDYIEAHGTGTKLGDPVEIAGLTRAFNTEKKQFCAIGSVKSNIGHLDTAAGVAGLIKAVLSLQHGQLVPSLHYQQPNPEIDFANSPFYVNTTLRPWERNGHPRRAGVSAFGIGGTNVHVVLEEAPGRDTGSTGRSHQLLLLSGKTPGALERNAARLSAYLQQDTTTSLNDIAYTQQVGRESFYYRRMLVCRNRSEALALLNTPGWLSAGSHYISDKRTVGVAFLFPGQGSQYSGMCQGLYEEEPHFRSTVDECLSIVQRRCGKDLRPVLFGEDARMDQTEYTQPCLFIIEYSLARLLMSWGVQPSMMIGHSIGEYVAACVSGVFSLSDALYLVVKRGECMQAAPTGKMLSVSLDREGLLALCGVDICLAAVNGPSSGVLSGRESSIAALKLQLESSGHVCRELRTSHGFHSHLMDEVLPAFRGCFSGITFHTPSLPFISNVTGKEALADEICQADYWVNHLRSTVDFSGGLSTLLSTSSTSVLLEVGPGKVLSTLCSMAGQEGIPLVRGARDTGADGHYLLTGLGQLWERGVSINWRDYYGNERRLKVPLPGYSFEQVKYPVHVDAYQLLQQQLGSGTLSDKGRKLSDWFYVPGWRQSVVGTAATATRQILLLSDAGGFGARLSARLRSQGHEVVEVYQGSGFSSLSVDVYEIDGGVAGDFSQLASILSSGGFKPTQLLHLWSMDRKSAADYTSLCYSVSNLAITWQHCSQELVLLTEEGELIRGDESGDAYSSLGQSLLKVIGQEYPGLRTQQIDISYSGVSVEWLEECVCRELSAVRRGSVIGLRRGQRWQQHYDALRLDREGSVFRDGGVYLITGGLGQLGYTLSKYLLSRYQAKLILVGRNRKLSGDKQTRYEELCSLGVVRYVACDISDAGQLKAALVSSEEQLGTINGVIHAAGVVDGRSIGLLPELSTGDYMHQFDPKISGLHALWQVLADRALDFCVLTSSISTVLGGLGFGAYATANRYMDQFVQREVGSGRLQRWLSVSLDGLDFTADNKTEEITRAEISEMMEIVLSHRGLSHVVVSKTPLQGRLEQWVTGTIDNGEQEEVINKHLVFEKTASGVSKQLQTMWEGFFGKADLGGSADFFEIGGDSLKALTMLSRIHKTFGVDMSIRDFYDHPVLSTQSLFIYNRLETTSSNKQTTGRSITIPSAGGAGLYALSAAQRRMYFLHAFDKAALTYNMPHVIRLEGTLDAERLRTCFEQLIARHEILRTSFELHEGEVKQRVHETIAGFEWTIYESDAAGVSSLVDQFIRPFDLGQAPLLRAGLIRIGEAAHVLLVDMHHVVTDGVSTDILVNDFSSLYRGAELPALHLQYKDYAQWQQSAAEQVRISAQRAFWKKQYNILPDPLNLPVDFTRPIVKSSEGAVSMNELSTDLTTKLRALAERERVSMFMLLLSIYHVLLSKLSNQEDIVIGTPTAGRLHADLEGVMGMFVNTLPLRNAAAGEDTFSSFLQRIKENTLSCFDNQEYQYEDMIEALEVARDMGRNPLFDVMFSYENFEDPDLQLEGLKLTTYDRNYTASKFDMTLIASEGEEKIYINFEYSTALFKPATIERFVGYFKQIAATVIEQIDIQMSQISVLGEEERQQLLTGFNDTGLVYPTDKSLLALFDQLALQTPDKAALRFEEEVMTYGELKTLSDNIALYFRDELQLAKGGLVGVMTAYDLNFIPLLYGLLKAGGVYVPIDPQHPVARINTIASDAGLSLVIKHREDKIELTGEIQVLNIEDLAVAVTGPKEGALSYTLSLEDLAYVIYTSGSTGEPKGVMIEHGSLLNIIHALQAKYPLTSQDSFLLKTAFSFDVSIAELFGWFMEGGSLCILDPVHKTDMREVVAAIKRFKATHINFVPSVFAAFVDTLKEIGTENITSLKYIFLAGEALSENLVNDFRKFGRDIKLENIYGPTEGTVYSSAYSLADLQEGMKMSIGKPISNVRLYILDKYGALQPVGVPGELCIGGAGVARGYLNNISLTAEKFIPNPYVPMERIYRTGDLTRWLEDGNIEYLGRIDDQVKLRGLRIELGEIAVQLGAHPAIAQSVVVVKERAADKYIVAYYISDRVISPVELRIFLRNKLPDYMIPSFFVHLEQFPLTSSGKVDKKALPLPELKVEVDYKAPEGQVEEKLVEIWASVLQVDPQVISVHRNFFELGGNSLKIVSLNQLINKAFNCNITTADMFGLTTIRDMKQFILGTNTQLQTKQTYKSTYPAGDKGTAIAIVGLDGRFPGANDISHFWDNLMSGVESISFFSQEELLEAGEDAHLLSDPAYVKANAYVDKKEFFDASFFGYQAAEARLMDPQMRLFHEVCWTALENAGYGKLDQHSKIGLFASAASNPNWEVYAMLKNEEESIDDFSASHLRDISFLTTKISYKLNLKGPAIFVQSACSSSLMAVHQACRSLLAGDCTMALAGGIAIKNISKTGYLHQEGMIHSADGHCRAFDAAATGTVDGEGAGVVLLKRLDDAVRDGDHIYAVIRGTGINNDGNDKVGYTAPSINGQREAIDMAYASAGVEPSTIGYIEAHGTGTKLGDPVEIAGLTRAFNTEKKQFCAIGSVKSNIGHLDTAAGVAGLIKAVLSLQHGQLVPSLHYQQPNPEIDFANSPFYVNTTLRPWERNGHPRRAGVSAFGIGGTNVHVVLEEAPGRDTGSTGRSHQLLLLSGKTPGALERNAARLSAYLQQDTTTSLNDIAYTQQVGREAFQYRRMLVCRNRSEALALLNTPGWLSAGSHYISDKRTVGVAFLFPGQGSQYSGMCQGLYEEEPHFRSTVDECLSIVQRRCGKDLRPVLFGADARMDQTEYTQPCLFIIEYSLARLLMSWGVQPSMMIGHSIGEYVAACVSGVFSLSDALYLVVKRGECMQAAPTGKMLSVSLDREGLLALCGVDICLAAVNGPSSGVLSGRESSIAALKLQLESSGHVCRELRTSHGFHSHLMDEVLPAFRGCFSGITFHTPSLPFISNVTGKEALADEICQADYWVNHLRSTVDFSGGLSTLLSTSSTSVLLEVGPGKVLSTLCSMAGQEGIPLVRGARDTGADGHYLLTGLGQLWERGVSINWRDYYGNERRLKVPLPGYSFEQVKYPVHVDAYQLLQQQLGSGTLSDKGRKLSDWFYVPGWRQSVRGLNQDVQTDRQILVFCDKKGFGARLSARLGAQGHQVVEVYRGTAFNKRDTHTYEIDATLTESYQQLAAALNSEGFKPNQLLHVWSMDNKGGADYTSLCYSLATMASTWQHCSQELVLLTEEGELIRGDESGDAYSSLGQSLLKVIGQEYPGLRTQHIDISQLGISEATLEMSVCRELSAIRSGTVIGLRRGKRWQQHYDALSLEREGSVFRQGGVYLITGGLGQLGYTLSKYLLTRYKARLVLVGRNAMLDGDRQTRYEELRNLGAVRYVACDISDAGQLKAALVLSEEQLGTINGVIHTAGVIEGRSIGLLPELNTADYMHQFNPKINGLQSLSVVLAGRALDFCLLTSSISTVLGGVGYGAYATANRYMDQFVQREVAAGRLEHWVSVGLDGLEFKEHSSDQDITGAELCEVLELILSNRDLPHVVVSKTALDTRLKKWVEKGNDLPKQEPVIEAVVSNVETVKSAPVNPIPGVNPRFLGNEYVAPRNELDSKLTDIWKEIFSVDSVGIDDNFFALGGHSLNVFQMLNRIRKLDYQIHFRDMYDYQTIEKLSDYLMKQKKKPVR